MAAAPQRLHGDRSGRRRWPRPMPPTRRWRKAINRGALHGVPLAHKDMYYDAGKVVTCGSKIRRDFVATTTSTALQRLKDAGTIRLGSLQMVEFAYGPTGHNPHYGAVHNPWNVDHITGGSSSGSGSAVAARLTFAALGSDTGGSIRMPAHFCGVTGLKTTYRPDQPRRRDAAVAIARHRRAAGAHGEDCALAAGPDGGRRPRRSHRGRRTGAGLHGGDQRPLKGLTDRRAHRVLCRRSRFRSGAHSRRDHARR
jgi:aspartyl-tRNA(Asn)/glutamyl-tRNA(Gln) amidotransferase subunit A